MRLPPRACSTPGCFGTAVVGSRCPRCERARQTAVDSSRGSSNARGYDSVHRRLRVMCFERDAWRCVACGWEPPVVQQCRTLGIEAPPTEVILEELRLAKQRNDRHLHADHREPVERRPDLSRELDNYQTLCNLCHAAKTVRENCGFAPGRPRRGPHLEDLSEPRRSAGVGWSKYLQKPSANRRPSRAKTFPGFQVFGRSGKFRGFFAHRGLCLRISATPFSLPQWGQGERIALRGERGRILRAASLKSKSFGMLSRFQFGFQSAIAQA